MDEQAVFAADLEGDLPDGLEEGLTFDVTRCAANLGDQDIGVGRFRAGIDEALDLLRDVRDDLHRLAEVGALAFLVQHIPIYLTRGEVGKLVEVFVDEAFIMSEVEIRFRAILGDEHLAVLIGAHGAGVDVHIRVELLRGDFEAAQLEKATKGGGGDALAESGDDAAGDEDVFAHDGSILSLRKNRRRKRRGSRVSASLKTRSCKNLRNIIARCHAGWQWICAK